MWAALLSRRRTGLWKLAMKRPAVVVSVGAYCSVLCWPRPPHPQRRITTRTSALSEGEHVRLGARFQERDLECSLADSIADAHKLIEPAFQEGAVPFLVDVHAGG